MKKALILIVAILVGMALLVIAGVLLYLFVFKKPSGPPKPLTPTQQRALQVDLPTMTTNLLNGSGLIQLAVTLQASNAKAKADIAQLQPEIQDEINLAAHRFTVSDLQASDSQTQLGDLIQSDINRILPDGRITKVLFTTWVVQ